ncbi:MAG: GXGXG motif-containing protein, partial [bacterium]
MEDLTRDGKGDGDAANKSADAATKSHDMGLHDERLTGRAQQVFFDAAAEENFTYPWAFEVDFERRAEFDALEMDATAINLKIRELMRDGVGAITVHN